MKKGADSAPFFHAMVIGSTYFQEVAWLYLFPYRTTTVVDSVSLPVKSTR